MQLTFRVSQLLLRLHFKQPSLLQEVKCLENLWHQLLIPEGKVGEITAIGVRMQCSPGGFCMGLHSCLLWESWQPMTRASTPGCQAVSRALSDYLGKSEVEARILPPKTCIANRGTGRLSLTASFYVVRSAINSQQHLEMVQISLLILCCLPLSKFASS